jgi:hypothetical protein
MTEIPVPEAELEAKPALAEALAAFQAEVPRITKDSRAKIDPRDPGKRAYEYPYADLGAMTETVMPLLGKHGLAFCCKPTWMVPPGGQAMFCLIYKLMHSSGQQEVGIWPLPHPSQAKPQDLGSAITYGRRYSFQAVTGVAPAPGEDDDAAQAQAAPLPEVPQMAGRPQGIEAAQKRRILRRLTDMGVADDPETWLSGITGEHIGSLDELSRYRASAVLDELRPAGNQARSDVIGALAGVGVTDPDDALAQLSEWTGRLISATSDLCVCEAGLAMRQAAQARHEQREHDQAGEGSQDLPP